MICRLSWGYVLRYMTNWTIAMQERLRQTVRVNAHATG